MRVSSPRKMKPQRNPRRFGLVMAAALAVVGGIAWWRSTETAHLYLWACAGLFLVLALAWPRALSPLERAWGLLAAGLGWLNLRILLTAAYILVFVPVGLVFKVIGKDPLDRRIDRSATTYWKDRTTGVPDPASYERQH